jgi:NDP-sugar pyrophosphorylase family protein
VHASVSYNSRNEWGALDWLPSRQFPELVQTLLRAGQPVAAYPAGDTEWFHVGTLGELERATARLDERPDLFEPR